ncbi:MAG: peptidase M24 [Bacteroidetes bacterium]|nr:MAG: peptidase M24 [Bacteroidota bacterium]
MSRIDERVEQLRGWLKAQGAYAIIVPCVDPHGSEYIADHWMIREWISGFTGSAGTAIVSLTDAALWTDSRYFLQGEEQLAGTPFKLMKEGMPDTPSQSEWLRSEAKRNGAKPEECQLALIGALTTVDEYKALDAELSDVASLMVMDDPFKTLWKDRPSLPCRPLSVQPMEYAGMAPAEKLEALRSSVAESTKADYCLVSDLAQIAWLLNLRGADIDYNPVFMSYLMVGLTGGATLCVDPSQLTDGVKSHLASCGVETAGYDDLAFIFAQADGVVAMPSGITLNVVNLAHANALSSAFIESPVEMMKARKNDAELEGFREAMRRDGVALVRFFSRLEGYVAQGGFTEVNVDEKLTAERAAQKGFDMLSFSTIAGYGPHGAIVHYEAEPETASTLEQKSLLLLDSGAQYDCGTTDITRTVPLGPLSQEEREAYTLVLKGTIGVSTTVFPEGTTGLQLDVPARRAMWQKGYDYGHGTGHGVGSHLNVHEGPAQLRKNVRGNTLIPYEPGMITSIEPGIYIPGKAGVRIENLAAVVEDRKTDFGTFYRFETLTLCPIDTRPIIKEWLTKEEIDWLNEYHTTVLGTLLPLLEDDHERQWLMEATKPI